MKKNNSNRKIKKLIYSWYLVFANKKTPLLTKLLVVYIIIRLSIPLSFLPDIIIVPILILIVVKLTPKKVIDDSQTQAEEMLNSGKKINFKPIIIIVVFWLIIVLLTSILVLKNNNFGSLETIRSWFNFLSR